jgi:hypothetical protein
MVAYANYIIDSVQSAKSNALKTLVTEAKVREPLQSIIEAQTSFAKDTIKAIDAIVSFTQSTVAEQASKFSGK